MPRDEFGLETKAKELGLVDEIGELDDAILAAAELAEIENYRIYEYPRLKNQWEQLVEQFTNTDKTAKLTIDEKLGAVIPYYDFLQLLLAKQGATSATTFSYRILSVFKNKDQGQK